MSEHPSRFGFSVSHTTRDPRPGEQTGREYHFTTREAFQNLVNEDGFLEHATFSQNMYGTSAAAVRTVMQQGRICILDIEMEGVKQIRKREDFGSGPRGSGARYLFLSPPSLEELEKRLRGRGTDSEEDVRKRLEQARREMEFAQTNYQGPGDHVVVNDDLEKAYREVKEWSLKDG